MTLKRAITPEMEQAIIAYLNANDAHTWRQVATRWGLGWPSTQRLLHRLVAEGIIQDRGLGGRKQRGQAKMHAIRAMAAANPHASAGTIGKALGVSQPYVSRVLRQSNTMPVVVDAPSTWVDVINKVHPRAQRRMRIALLRERWELAQWHAALQREEQGHG
jgi:DNA-binding MarR family transcriptional regulator